MTNEGKRNLVLCGFMATGKSSVGKALAELTGFEFVDMDAVIEAEQGISIPRIFATRGEAAFRALESELVERLTRRVRCIIATGGGTIVNPQNFEKLKSCGVLVNLTADIDTILSRAGSGEDRPMLKGEDRRERIRGLLELRAPAYARCDISVDTSSLTVDEVAEFILSRIDS